MVRCRQIVASVCPRVFIFGINIHAIFMIIMPLVLCACLNAIKIFSLKILKPLYNRMQFFILWSIFLNGFQRPLFIGIIPLITRAVTLGRKTRKENCYLIEKLFAAVQTYRSRSDIKPKKFRNSGRVFINVIVPIIIKPTFTIPLTRLFFCLV